MGLSWSKHCRKALRISLTPAKKKKEKKKRKLHSTLGIWSIRIPRAIYFYFIFPWGYLYNHGITELEYAFWPVLYWNTFSKLLTYASFQVYCDFRKKKKKCFTPKMTDKTDGDGWTPIFHPSPIFNCSFFKMGNLEQNK